MTTALEWGQKYGSCPEALEWRASLGHEATQADAWMACQRSDWMLWQLRRLSPEKLKAVLPALRRAITRIVERAVERHAG